MIWPHFSRQVHLDRWNRKHSKLIGMRPSALHSTSLNFPLSKDASQNCFVFFSHLCVGCLFLILYHLRSPFSSSSSIQANDLLTHSSHTSHTQLTHSHTAHTAHTAHAHIHTYTHTHAYTHTHIHTYKHTLKYITLPLHYITLHYITLHTLTNYISSHYIPLHYITLPYIHK